MSYYEKENQKVVRVLQNFLLCADAGFKFASKLLKN